MLDQRRILELRNLPYEQYLKTPEWKQKRDEALERDGHCCRACNSSEKLQVHHRTYKRRGNENLNDLTTLCESCHEHFHKKMSQDEIMQRTYQEPHVSLSKEGQAQKWEDYLIGMLLQYPSLYLHVCGLLSDGDFHGSDTLALYQLFSSVTSLDQSFEQFVPQPLMLAAHKSIRATDRLDEFGLKTPLVITGEMRVKTAIEVAMRIKDRSLLRSAEEITARIQEARNAGDHSAERQLRGEIVELHRQRHAMKKK